MQLVFSFVNWQTWLHPLKGVRFFWLRHHTTELHIMSHLGSRHHPLLSFVVLVIKISGNNKWGWLLAKQINSLYLVCGRLTPHSLSQYFLIFVVIRVLEVNTWSIVASFSLRLDLIKWSKKFVLISLRLYLGIVAIYLGCVVTSRKLNQ